MFVTKRVLMLTKVSQLDLDPIPGEAECVAADLVIEEAIEVGDASSLCIVGYGEVTLAVGWPSNAPRWVIKRLPRFGSDAAFEEYRSALRDYCDALAERGVQVSPTYIYAAKRDGNIIAYLIQPFFEKSALLTEFMKMAGREEARAQLEKLSEIIRRGVDDKVGMDSALPNWAIVEGELQTFDISTPWIRDQNDRDRLSKELILSVYPWLARGLLRKFVIDTVFDDVHSQRLLMVDLGSNLLRWGNDAWLDDWIEIANRHAEPPITQKEVIARLKSDKQVYPLMNRLRRFDRWWSQKIMGRSYVTLLPPKYSAERTEAVV